MAQDTVPLGLVEARWVLPDRRRGALAGAGAHFYSAGDAAGGSEEAARS